MSLLFSLALRNALRNRRRSLLTALTITLGVALLTVAMAWVNGVFNGMLRTASANLGHVRVVSEGYARKEQIQPLWENLSPSAPIEEALRKAPGVKAVYPRILLGVTGSAGDEIGERFALVQGAPIAYLEEVQKLSASLVKGRMLQPTTPAADDALMKGLDKETVLGATFAEEIGADVGSQVILLGVTQDGSPSAVKLEVVGIADFGGGAANRQAFVTLEKARWMADIPDGAVELLVFGEDYRVADGLAEQLRALPEARGLDVQAWSTRPPFDQLLGFARTIRAIAVAVVVFITALGVLNTMLMSVFERTAEIGVMRAMGLRAWETVVLFVVEALGISVIGGLLGGLLGGAAGTWLEIRGVRFGDAVSKLPDTLPFKEVVHADMSPDILLTSFLLGLVMAVIGSATPALRATRIQPVEAMRSRH